MMNRRNFLIGGATAAAPVLLGTRYLSADPLGLHAFVADFRRKVENLTQALADGRLRAIQAVMQSVSGG